MKTETPVGRQPRKRMLYCMICKGNPPNSRSASYCAECREVLDRIQGENDHQPFPYIPERVAALQAHTERIRADIAAGRAA